MDHRFRFSVGDDKNGQLYAKSICLFREKWLNVDEHLGRKKGKMKREKELSRHHSDLNCKPAVVFSIEIRPRLRLWLLAEVQVDESANSRGAKH